MGRLRRVASLPADPPRPGPRIQALDDLCTLLTTTLRSVSVQARYRNLGLLAWPDATSDRAVHWKMLDRPTYESEQVQIWWPAAVDRLPRSDQAAVSAEVLRQVLIRLAVLRHWPEKERDQLLAVLEEVPPVQIAVRCLNRETLR